MRTNKTLAAGVVVGLFLIAAVAWAAGDEKTITGVISKVNPTTRIATVTPASGPPIVVQFAFNAGGPCSACLGSGRSGPDVRRDGHRGFDVDAHLHVVRSRGCGHMVPRGHRQHGDRAVAVKAK